MVAKQEGKRLYRSEDDRIIAGVAGGIAEYFNIDPVLVRIVTALAILSGGRVILYILLWLFVPTRATVKLSREKSFEANVEELGATAEKFGQQAGRAGTWGILLIVLGIYFLLQNFSLIPWWLWDQVWKLWPVVLVLVGIRVLNRK